MFKRTVLRLLRVAAALVGLLVTSLGVAGYLALSEPSFYASLRGHQTTPAEADAAAAQMEQQRAAYVRWRSRLALDQQAGQEGERPPAPEAHEVRFSSGQLNALIASETKSLAGGAIEDPRVRVTTDRIDIACGVQTPAARFVVSAGFKPTLTPDGALELVLESASLGRLPIPCQTLCGFFSPKRERLSGNLYLELTGSKPRLTLDLTDKAETLMAETVECAAGEVTVRFVARPRAK